MKKIRVRGDTRFDGILAHIKGQVERCEGVGAEFVGDDLVINLGKNSAGVRSCVLDAICEVVVVDCKAHYINSQVIIPTEDPLSRHAFIRALCEFDYETDKVLVRGLVELTPIFLIGGFYDFCLDILKRRWDEVCILTKENMGMLLVGSNFFELLKYLISNIESRAEELTVRDGVIQGDYGVYVNGSIDRDVRLVEMVVALGPRRITWCDPNDDVFEFLTNLYGDAIRTPHCVSGTLNINVM
ncbi:MAG: hypothetical protein FWE38_05440 [Firmicutes bacterium]|nr:hypothetical protein [Bacillota bacterium]